MGEINGTGYRLPVPALLVDHKDKEGFRSDESYLFFLHNFYYPPTTFPLPALSKQTTHEKTRCTRPSRMMPESLLSPAPLPLSLSLVASLKLLKT